MEQKIENQSSILNEKILGKPVTQIIGELEFMTQVNTNVLDLLISLNPSAITQKQIEDLKELSAKQVNIKYGFDMLTYTRQDQKELEVPVENN